MILDLMLGRLPIYNLTIATRRMLPLWLGGQAVFLHIQLHDYASG